jgi:hypothetical protein
MALERTRDMRGPKRMNLSLKPQPKNISGQMTCPQCPQIRTLFPELMTCPYLWKTAIFFNLNNPGRCGLSDGVPLALERTRELTCETSQDK